MEEKLKVGVIGCGRMGNIYCKLIKNISANVGGINFTGIFDIDRETASKASKEYGVKNYGSYEAMLEEVEAIFVVTPTVTHFEISKSALARGVNLYIEKPVTANLKEAEELIRLSNEGTIASAGIKRRNPKVQVGHVERFNPAILAVEKYQLEPMFIEAHRLSQFNPRGTDVTVIHDLMIHDIDLVLSLVKSPIERVDANGVSVVSESIDIANARLKFKNDCVANLTSSRISQKKMRKMRIFQRSAYISLDFLENKAEVFRLIEGKVVGQSGKIIPISESKSILFEEMEGKEEHNPIEDEIKSFIDSILYDKPVKVTLEDAKRALEVGEEIVQKIWS